MTKDYKPKTADDGRKYLRSSHSKFRRLVKKDTRKRGIGVRPKLYFDTLIGNRPMPGKRQTVSDLLATDLKALHEFGNYMIDEAEKLSLSNPNLEFYHVTLLAEEGVILERESFVPVSPIKKKIHNCLSRDCKLDFVAAIECQGLTNWPQNSKGRTLLVHVHALVWFDPRRVKGLTANTERGLEGFIKSRAWFSNFDAKPVSAVKITENRGSPAWFAAYLFKSPHSAKRRVKIVDPDSDSLFDEFKLKPVTSDEGYRPEFAMRIFELRSHLKLSELVVAGGAGAAMKRRCFTRLRAWQQNRRWLRKPMKHFNLDAFRRQIKRNRRRHYGEFFVW